MVILVDDEDRENEGDLVIAAEHATPEAINFMAGMAAGSSAWRSRASAASACAAADDHPQRHGARHRVHGVHRGATGVTTGISAADRASTIQAAMARDARPSDLVQPGHIFPLQARDGGVLMRAGHTEAGATSRPWRACPPPRSSARS